MVFWSRWRAVIREQLGLKPRGENCKPPWAVKKLDKEIKEIDKKRTSNRRQCSSYGNATCICPLYQKVHPYHRGVMLRNTFNPMRGPSMSPAPNSTYRDTDEIESVSDMPVCAKIAKEKKKCVKKVYYCILTHSKFQMHLPKMPLHAVFVLIFCIVLCSCVCMCVHLSPALGRRNSSYGHINVAPSISIVCRQWTRQHCRVRVCQRSLKKGSCV